MTSTFRLNFILSILLLPITQIAFSQTEDITVRKSEAERGLLEVNHKFTFRGRPLNPKVVNAFVPWMSDSRPSSISIDLVTASGSNQYYLEPEDTGTFANLKDLSGTNLGYCSYKYLGKTENNIHVVRITTNGGGTGNFNTLMFFSFKVRKAFDMNGTTQDQLLMTLERMYLEGDRTVAKVVISKNKVFIDKPASSPRTVELNF